MTDIEHDAVSAGGAAAMHNLLDAPGSPPGEDDPLPILWHWMAFLPRTPQRDLGADGHPQPTGELAAVAIGPRMFAGASVTIVGQGVSVGEALRRSATVTRVEDKEGRSGLLRFVTIRYEIDAGSGAAIVDEQELLYRPVAPPAGPRTAAAPSSDETSGWPWELVLTPSPTMLFRFSALTYNAHRIHYDVPYATGTEGYPGLVVHGPLQAIALAEVCRRFAAGRRVTSFRFRAVSPAFAGAPLRFAGAPSSDGTSVSLRAVDERGVTTMTAEATLRAN
jgi:3-methylfumaryl-CoA hydratase